MKEIESLISKAILELNFYETTPENAKDFGIEAKKPLYVQNLFVSENERLIGIGKKVLNYLEDYARKNGNDVIFGYVERKASFTKDSRQSFFCDVDMIKNWLHNNGYAINVENNHFHKVVKSLTEEQLRESFT
jgi:GNAT superfamily N-acetyltransferase